MNDEPDSPALRRETAWRQAKSVTSRTMLKWVRPDDSQLMADIR